MVTKVAEDGGMAWSVGPWNKAKGASTVVSETGTTDGKSLRFDITFSGGDFEFAAFEPGQALVIPGRTRRVIVRSKASEPGYGLTLNFKDGWGRGGKPFEKGINTKQTGAWLETSIDIPADWVQPLSLGGVATHNWGKQGEARTISFWIDEIRVETDIAGVDPATGALAGWTPEPNPAEPEKALKECPRTAMLAVDMAPTADYGVFSGENPALLLTLRNWRTEALSGTLSWQVVDAAGKVVGTPQQKAVKAESSAAIRIDVPVPKYGLYTVKASLKMTNGTRIDKEMKVAKLPVLPNLTREQKIASPYGMNVHSGGKIVIEPFKKAGIVWFREYAFSYDWLVRAKGADKRYGGWPYFPKIVQAYRDLDVIMLPVLQGGIKPPQVEDGKAVGPLGPDTAWRREIADVVTAFPDVQFWELSNEYDLKNENRKAEQAVGWKNYQLYHEVFAQVLKALEVMGGGPYYAIENGRAGIWPELVRDCIESGHFADIHAVNSHHYCGTDPPETNFNNANINLERSRSFFDDLREQKRVAVLDGKPRESWFTEFGWDILAGRIVTPYQQAVYLPRAWMLQMAAGTDKCFWFYNFDAANPRVFFDGMGLLDAQGQPKANLCTLAALTHLLPQPSYVGSINAGANTQGYVFANDGKLVASLWSIKGDDGPEVAFAAGELRDGFANPLPGLKAKLTMAPVYLVGLSKDDPWYRQTAYEVESPHLVTASPADAVEVVVRIRNNRATPLVGEIALKAPAGWECGAPTATSVAPGETKDVSLKTHIPNAQPLGEAAMTVHCAEAGRPVKQMPVAMLIRPAATIAAPALHGAPGQTEVPVRITNHGLHPLSGTLKLELPETWSTPQAEFAIAAIAPGESREIMVALTWASTWPAGQSALLRVLGPNGLDVTAPIIPPQYLLRRAKAGLKIDGDLADWPADAQLPAWMLGRKVNDADAKVFLAWAPEGLYGAVAVKNSRIVNQDPNWFWACDALEIFLDTRNDKTTRTFVPGDHQFWFVPLPKQNRVFVGQWKRGTELDANRVDIPSLQTASRKQGDGYVMEFLLPAADLKAFAPKAGGQFGVNLNLTVYGNPIQDEVYWPHAKDSGVNVQPANWGTLDLQP
jgi:hypothetical protein